MNICPNCIKRSAKLPRIKRPMSANDASPTIIAPAISAIPEIVFRNADLHDVVSFLVEQSRLCDKDEKDPARRGASIIVNVARDEDIPKISFTARQVSFLEAAKIVAEVAGLSLRIERGYLMMTRRRACFDGAGNE